MMRFKTTTALTATLALSTGAMAQQIDYGSLEMMFEEAVTTSATGKPQRSSEAPVTMEIITADDIRRSGATEIPDVLRQLAGLDVIQRTQGQFDVNVRGYNQAYSPRLLVLINGRQVYLDHYGMTAWAALPVTLEEIRQIEVVKGPNTALFGFNAVSGVINIITFNPIYDDVNKVTAKAGIDDDYEVSGVASFKVGEASGVRVSGKYTSRDERREVLGLNPNLFDKQERKHATIDGRFQANDKLTFGIEGTISAADLNEFNAGYLSSRAEYETWSLKGTATYDAGDVGLISASLYRNDLDVALPDVPGTLGNKITVLQLQDLVKLSADHTLRLQGEYRKNETSADLTTTLTQTTMVDYSIFALSAMWDWKVTDKLAFTASGRVDFTDVSKSGFDISNFLPLGFTNDDFSDKGTEYSINAGLVYAASDVDTIRFSMARGIGFPSQVDTGLTLQSQTTIPGLGTVPFLLISTPGLESTAITNFEIGYDRKLSAIDATLRTSFFYQKQSNIRSFLSALTPRPELGGLPVSTISNVGSSKMSGIEVGLKGTFADTWRYDVNYTFLDINDDLPDTGAPVGVPVGYPVQFEDAAAKHAINASIGTTIDAFEFDVFAHYKDKTVQLDGRFPVFYNVPVEDNFRVDARAAYQVNDMFTVALTGSSLFDKTYKEAPQMHVDRRLMLQLTASF